MPIVEMLIRAIFGCAVLEFGKGRPTCPWLRCVMMSFFSFFRAKGLGFRVQGLGEAHMFIVQVRDDVIL